MLCREHASAQKKYQGNLVKVNLNGKGDTYLDKDFKVNVDTFIDEASKNGVTLKFNSAYRSPKYQKGLKGDPTAITPATNSLHSAGLAVDVNYASLSNIRGGLTGDQQRTIIRNAASAAGLSWGGNFKTPDVPHFYIDPGTSRVDLINNATNSLKSP